MEEHAENQNYFLPNDDIFTAYLNADSDKPNIRLQDAYDNIFKEQKKSEPSLAFPAFSAFNSKLGPSDDRNSVFRGSNQLLNSAFIKNSNEVLAIKNNTVAEEGLIDPLRKQKKKVEKKLSMDSKTSKSDKGNTIHNSTLTSDAGKTIFKTIKIKNPKRKDEKGEGDIKKLVRLYKNRISAKKCRQKRKVYIESLENKVEALQQELTAYENMKKTNVMETFLEDLSRKENDILFNSRNKDRSFQTAKIKEYKALQNQYSIDIFKKIIHNIIPLEFKVFASKYIKFADLGACSNFGELVEKIIENQIILDEVYNLRSGQFDKMNSMPLKIFGFFEKLKEFIFNFQELILDIKRFDEMN